MRIISFPKDFVDLRNSPIDIHDIEKNVRQFYLCLNINKNEDVKTQCLDAKSFLESARILVRNLISPEENIYISNYQKAYFFMQENLGRVDKKINEVEVENIDQLFVHEKYQDKKIIDSPSLRRYINSLITCMEHLVYYPLKNALKKYNETDKTPKGEEIKKDKNLYSYFLFLELLHSSESLGSVTAEKSRSKAQSISPNQVPEKDFGKYSNAEDTPPSLPKDLEIEKLDTSIKHSAEEFFNNPTEETEELEDIKIYEDDDMEITEENEDESD